MTTSQLSDGSLDDSNLDGDDEEKEAEEDDHDTSIISQIRKRAKGKK